MPHSVPIGPNVPFAGDPFAADPFAADPFAAGLSSGPVRRNRSRPAPASAA